jgi:RNA polymerase sigma-70 factor (ECF subfamily)
MFVDGRVGLPIEQHINVDALVERIAAGDHSAFESVFRRFERPLHGYFLRATHDPHSAEDLVCETMAAVWKSARGFRGESSASTWVFGVAYHLLARSRRRQRRDTPLEDAESLAADGDPEHMAERADVATRLRRAVDALPAAHRDVVDLTFYHGFAYPDVARILGIPVNTVKTRMFHARQKLRALCEAAGIGDES